MKCHQEISLFLTTHYFYEIDMKYLSCEHGQEDWAYIRFYHKQAQSSHFPEEVKAPSSCVTFQTQNQPRGRGHS